MRYSGTLLSLRAMCCNPWWLPTVGTLTQHSLLSVLGFCPYPPSFLLDGVLISLTRKHTTLSVNCNTVRRIECLRPKVHTEACLRKERGRESKRDQPSLENIVSRAGKMALWLKEFAVQAWWSEFDFWHPLESGKREPTPWSRPLTFTVIVARAPPWTHNNNKFTKRKISSRKLSDKQPEDKRCYIYI